MSRPVTLFTGQWADLPLETLAKKASGWGFDGLELACWGDHFDAAAALEKDSYVKEKRALLEKNNLKCFAISTHLIGQCVADDPIDDRHKNVLPDRLWGDGKPEGVRQRCAEEVKRTAKAAKLLGVNVVNGFTGSPVWAKLYFFPPTTQAMIDAGYKDFAARWMPILDEFKKEGVKFALEVHPTEIAYDLVTAQRTLDALKDHPVVRFQLRPQPLHPPVHQPGGLHRGVPDAHLPLPRQGFAAAAERQEQHPRRPPGFRRRAARLGLRLPGPRRREVGPHHPCVQPHRVQRDRFPSSGKTAAWTANGAPPRRWPWCGSRISPHRQSPSTRPSQRDRGKTPWRKARRVSPRWPGRSPRRRRPRSASGCWAMPSWARRTRTPSRRSPT